MKLLKTFAWIVLAFFVFSLNSYGQKVEIKKDKNYLKTFNEGNKLRAIKRAKRHKVYIDNSPYAIIEEVFFKPKLIRQDKKVKYNVTTSNFEIKTLDGKPIAEIRRNFDFSSNSAKEVILPGFTIAFVQDDREHLIVSEELTLQNIVLNFYNFNIIQKNEISRTAKRKLFAKYGKNVEECRSGIIQLCASRSIPIYTITFNDKTRKGKVMNCSFLLTATTNDSTIKSIQFFNQNEEYIGEASIDSIGSSAFGGKELFFRFVSDSNEQKTISVFDRNYGLIKKWPDTPDSYLTYATGGHFIMYNQNFTEQYYNPKVIGQIVSLALSLERLYFL